MSPHRSSKPFESDGPLGALHGRARMGLVFAEVVVVIMLALAPPASSSPGKTSGGVSAEPRVRLSPWTTVSGGGLASSRLAGPCEVAPGGVCGRVVVPLNRRDPAGAKIRIAYVVFRHTDAALPALGTIFATAGGPGASAINSLQDAYLSLFGPLLGRRDLVLIDQRGVGRSRAIDCPALQSFVGDIYDLVAGCGAELGASSDLYGSAEVARDIEAVRASLGVGQFDFYGLSYAGMDIEAYAARFPHRLRSAVLDSPVVVPTDPWQTPLSAQIVKTVMLVCARSSLCSASRTDTAAELSLLARRLRAQPVTGVGRDADGVPHNVSVTEGELASILQNDSGSWLLQGEVLAAARALRGGDPAPLLRLDAESMPSSSGGPPPEPTLFSAGDAFARSCSDLEYQWDKASSPAQRRVQFDQARAALDPNRFAPFSLDAWVQPPPVAFLPSPCIRWPAPTHHPAPPVPIGTIVPDLPALLLMGELDLRVPPSESAQLTRMVPRTSAVTVAESGHVNAFNEQRGCAQALISHFIDTMTPGDTTCARHPDYIAPAVGSFPRLATTEPDSRTEQGSEGAADEHSLRGRVARIATATLTDAFRRTFIQEQPAHKGVGLRGGTFHAKETRTGLTLHLAAARLTEDVAVTGDATYDGTLDADLSVAGAAEGTLHVHGIWNEPGATRLVINGQLDGHQIGISVPAT